MSLSRASWQFRALTKDLGELVERHERAEGLESFKRYEEDLPAFAEDVLGVRLWSKQLEIWDALQSAPLVSVAGANGTGKDFFSAILMIHHAVCRRGLAILIAATQRQANEVCMGEVTRLWNRAKDLPGELFRSALRIDSDQACGIIPMASTEASRLTGFHGPRILGVLSEAQGLEPWVLEAFLSCAVGDQDKLLALGNPLFNTGWFFDSSRDPAWGHLLIPATDHPNVVEGRAVIPGGPTREWVEKMASKYGATSSIYRSRVLAVPPDQGEESLISRSWLDRAAARWAEAMARIERDRARGQSAEPTVAIDPARYGTGGGVLDRLEQLGYDVEEFNGGALPHSDRHQFLNRRAATYWHVRTMLEEDRIALPHDEELFSELLAVTWRPTADGKIQLEAKEQLKGRLGRSPDKADALTMVFGEETEFMGGIGSFVLGHGGIVIEGF